MLIEVTQYYGNTVRGINPDIIAEIYYEDDIALISFKDGTELRVKESVSEVIRKVNNET